MAGRRPLGPALVEHLTGSSLAKTRLRIILETTAGQCTIDQACQRLGIHQARFYKLRTRVLQTCVNDLEPKPSGRRPQPTSPAAQREAELVAEIAALRRELVAGQLRCELLQALPQWAGSVPASHALKKTKRRSRTRPKKNSQRPG